MKLPLPTTVSTVPPYRRLTAVKAITATVLQNVRRLTATTAGTGTTTAVLTAASPIGATVLPSARPVMPTTAGTKRRFRCRPTPTARPTTPTAPPNVPPGAVTQGTTSREVLVTSLRLPAEAPEVRREVLLAVRQGSTAAAAALKAAIVTAPAVLTADINLHIPVSSKCVDKQKALFPRALIFTLRFLFYESA